MRKLKEFLLINFGLFLVALGISLFKIPNSFAIGGVSGISIVVEKFFPQFPVGLLMLAINILLLVVGLIFLGFNFGSKTVYSSFALSGMVWILEKLFHVAKPLTGDKMLELAFAIILPAVGSAIVFNQNASTGGTDIVAKILNKYTHIHIGKTLFMADITITVAAGLVYGIRIGMYSLLGLVLKAFIIDLVIENLNICKRMEIVTCKPDEVLAFITEKIKRGATVHKAWGAFTNEEKEIITTVLTRRQAIQLRLFIREIDPKAFITITTTSEIIGKGFRNVDL